MKLLLLFALAAGAFAEKPALSDAQKAALMTAKADQLQAENDAIQAMMQAEEDRQKKIKEVKERAVQAAMALEKVFTDMLKAIGCEGGRFDRKPGSNDIEVSCPEKK